MENSLYSNTLNPKSLVKIPFFKDLEKEYLEMLSEKMQVFKVSKGSLIAELKWDDVRYLFDNKPEIMCYIFKNIGNTLSMRLRRVNSLYSHLANI